MWWLSNDKLKKGDSERNVRNIKQDYRNYKIQVGYDIDVMFTYAGSIIETVNQQKLMYSAQVNVNTEPIPIRFSILR